MGTNNTIAGKIVADSPPEADKKWKSKSTAPSQMLVSDFSAADDHDVINSGANVLISSSSASTEVAHRHPKSSTEEGTLQQNEYISPQKMTFFPKSSSSGRSSSSSSSSSPPISHLSPANIIDAHCESSGTSSSDEPTVVSRRGPPPQAQVRERSNLQGPEDECPREITSDYPPFQNVEATDVEHYHAIIIPTFRKTQSSVADTLKSLCGIFYNTGQSSENLNAGIRNGGDVFFFGPAESASAMPLRSFKMGPVVIISSILVTGLYYYCCLLLIGVSENLVNLALDPDITIIIQ